jgi:DNA polymerase III subunit beta
MRFNVSSTALSSRLQALAQVINSKNSLPILDCFLFDVQNDKLTITASDSENTLITTLEITDVEGEGSFAIANRTIREAVKELPEQPLNFDVDMQSLKMNISYMNGSYSVIGQNAGEYPLSQNITEDFTTIMMGAEVLNDGITRSLFATAQDELRPVMNGIYFDLTTDSLTIVASDGHKLVRNKNFTVKGDAAASFILPKKPSQILKGELGKSGGDVTLIFDKRNAEVKFGDFKLSCRLIEGRYPNYNSVIPSNNPNHITVDRVAFLSAMKRVIVFASAASMLVKYHIESGKLTMSSQDIDFSTSAEEQIDCEYDGTPMSIGFKGTSMIEILSNLTSHDVILELADPSRAGIITPSEQPENEDVLMLIMPMLLND